ncbi:MAG: hypothetical protein GXO87_02265 [Chlorobi bacterium]|nr:hypothetical protein [Chlorobiota bacterium]
MFDNLEGIISLLWASIEIVLLVNVIIFAEKNSVNKMMMLLIAFLFGYQILEFMICYVGLTSSLWVYFAFIMLSLLPPIQLLTILTVVGRRNKYSIFLFLPPLFFAIYYPFVLGQMNVTLCTILFAEYSYPLPELYGVFYYLPIAIAMYLMIAELKKDIGRKAKRNIGLLLSGYLFSFLSPFLFVLFFPPIISYIESFLCKFALFLAVAASIFALLNKTDKTEK